MGLLLSRADLPDYVDYVADEAGDAADVECGAGAGAGAGAAGAAGERDVFVSLLPAEARECTEATTQGFPLNMPPKGMVAKIHVSGSATLFQDASGLVFVDLAN